MFANAAAEADEQGDDVSDEETEFDWQIEQEPVSATALMVDGPKYGFANQRYGILQRLQVDSLHYWSTENIIVTITYLSKMWSLTF